MKRNVWGYFVDFPAWLRSQMEAHHYNQSKLAEVLGVRQSTISNWLSGKSEPTTDNLVMLSGVFDYDHLSLMEIAGVLPERSPALPNGDEQTLINTLKTLRGTPVYKPTLHTLQTIADLASTLLDPPPQEDEESNGEEARQSSS